MGILTAFAQAVTPKPKLTLSQWALEYMFLSAESSADPGKISFDDATYQPGMMDACSDPGISEVIIRTSSQVGKSTVLRAAIGYYSHQEPSPILVAVPTEKVATAFSEDFVETLIRDTPVLTPLFDSTEQIAKALHKTFPGGHLTLVGANNPSSLAMRPIRVVLGDEVDRWPLSAAKEGDPLTLAKARQKTYKPFHKTIIVSTPVDKETSLVQALFEGTDQRYFFVTCAECGLEQHLVWQQVKWDRGEPHKAEYCCEECGSLWDQRRLRALVKKGFWRATVFDAPKDRAGFSLNELYSPWSSMADMAKAFEEAEGKPDLEKAFRNTSLGLVWDGETMSTASEEGLAAHREDFEPRIVPWDAGKVTAACDLQRDRIEVLVCAWGREDECWALEHHKLWGDPSGDAVWRELEEFLLRQYTHANGTTQLDIEVVCIDSGGLSTDKAYAFTKKHMALGRNWLAIKGRPGQGQKIIQEANMRFAKDKTVKLFNVYTDDAKDWWYAHYKYEVPGPGYLHLPTSFDDGLLKQMTAEWRMSSTDKHGRVTMVWEKKKGARNEGLDLLVYNLAAHRFTDIDMDYRIRRLQDGRPAPGVDAVALGRRLSADLPEPPPRPSVSPPAPDGPSRSLDPYEMSARERALALGRRLAGG